jgi:hypothetical protein
MSDTLVGSVVKIENDSPVSGHGSVTSRGFRINKFTDRYGKECSLQKSSSAMEDCVWLGINQPDPIILARDALRLGRGDLVPGGAAVGWVPWPLPNEVQVFTRMHLTQDQVRSLLPALQHFVDTGELPSEE